ncbi:MAG: aminopeptidase P family protein [Acetobacter sp.]|nr:aminopeptidase P family protein [Acetobacter sp.]
MISLSHKRLIALRTLLKDENLDGLIIPHSDEYQSEYLPKHTRRLAWLTGFTGSAGTAIVLTDQAAIFSDGRYTTQLQQQVDTTCWHCLHSGNTPPSTWLTHTAPTNSLIGYDPRLTSTADLAPYKAIHTITLVPTPYNFIDKLWTERPKAPMMPAFIHPIEYAGENSENKRKRLAQDLVDKGLEATVISDSTSIAWLLNIRGNDIPCTPVVLAFALLYADASVDLFIPIEKIPPTVRLWLGENIRIFTPETLEKRLADLSHKTIGVDPKSNAVWFSQTLTHYGAHVVELPDPCLLAKARKNLTEQEGMRTAHLYDGIALCRFLHWLETQNYYTTEIAATEQLKAFRAEQKDYVEDSFPAISGSGSNGAIIHYHATPDHYRHLEQNEIYLIDSGGQYRQGTTDVTRTLWTGKKAPSDSLKNVFTRVLKGNLTLARTRFPVGTSGSALDVLARCALWDIGLDYDHGTGHGVGSFLSVHEGPARLSKTPHTAVLEEGMVLSNEPGFYKQGAYGIRLETLMLVKSVSDSALSPDSQHQFLEFETLTLVPFDKKLINPSLLGPENLHALNTYHKRILRLIAPYLPTDAQKWLQKACAPLTLT